MYIQPKLFFGDPVLTIIIDLTPIILLFVLLAGLRLSAWKATLIASLFTLFLAMAIGAPPDQTATAWAIGALFGIWSISWLIFWGVVWFNTWRLAGYLDAFRYWMFQNVTRDIRVLTIAIAWAFGALIEGLIGFGTPWAYIVPILVSLGIPTLRAITVMAVSNTAPVSYGAFGIPVVTLAGVTGLPLMFVSSAVAHIVAVLAMVITFVLLYLADGWRGIREAWPAALAGGLGYVLGQFTTAVYLGPYLPDIVGSILAFIFIVALSRVWHPSNIVQPPRLEINNVDREKVVRAWASLVVFVTIMGLWNSPISPLTKFVLATFQVSAFSEVLDKTVAVTYSFNPFATGTSALVAWLITLPIMGISARQVAEALKVTWRQMWGAVLTGVFVISLAFVFNFSGMAYSLAYLSTSVGLFFIVVSPFLGWLGAALTGSNTASNALFGAFQSATATLLGMPPGLFPALQSVGAELGKPVAPQTVSAGVSTSEYVRREGEVIRNNLRYSISLVFVLVLIGVSYLSLYPWPFVLH